MIRFISLALVLATNAYAADSRTWKMIDETDANLQLPSCRAYNVTPATSKTPAVEFSVRFPKGQKALPMITVRTRLLGNPSALLSVKLSSRESNYLFQWKKGALQADPDTFWYVPLNFAGMVQLIRGASDLQLTLDPKGVKTPITISLSGSSAALDQAAKCAGATDQSNEFLRLLNKEKDNLSPDLGDRSVDVLFGAVQSAFTAFQAGKGLQAQLEQLRKTFAPQRNEESAAQQALDAARATVSQTEASLASETALIPDLEARIAAARAELPPLQAQKSQADQVLAQKKAVFDPLAQQIAPYDSAISSASSRVSSADSEISQDESTVSQGESRISSLQYEINNLRATINTLQSELSSLRYDLSRADSDLSSFDLDREAQKILENDWSYKNLLTQQQQKRQELEGARRDTMEAQRNLGNLRGQLSGCQQRPGADCSSIQSQVSTAEYDLSQKQSRENSLQSDAQNLESQKQAAEASARNQADTAKQSLREKRDRVAADVRDHETSLAQSQNKVDQDQFELLNVKADVDRARTALPGLRRERDSAAHDLSSAQAARDALSRQIGFEAARSEYYVADQRVDELASAISQRNTIISDSQQRLQEAHQNVDAYTKDLVTERAAATNAGARLDAALAMAKPFHDQEAPLLSSIAGEVDHLKGNRAVYQQLYLYLADSLK